MHLLDGEDSEAGEWRDLVREGWHGAAVEDQLLQAHKCPGLVRQPPKIVVLHQAHSSNVTASAPRHARKDLVTTPAR